MPKRKTKESLDSNNNTSIEPARDFQHGAVTRIQAKKLSKLNSKTLKSINKKPIGEITNDNGQYWKGIAKSKAKSKAKAKTKVSKELKESKKTKERIYHP